LAERRSALCEREQTVIVTGAGPYSPGATTTLPFEIAPFSSAFA
jgi:hypothetical protein